MRRIALLVVLIINNLIGLNPVFSLELTLNVDGEDFHFPFTETITSNQKHPLPSLIILDGTGSSTITQLPAASSIRGFHIEADESRLNIATVIQRADVDDPIVFATVQTPNGSFYDISPSVSPIQPRTKRSLVGAYVVRQQHRIVERATVTIVWPQHRDRRDAGETESVLPRENPSVTGVTGSGVDFPSTLESVSLPDTMENITLPSGDNETESTLSSTTTTTTPRPIPAKSRHLYLEIVAAIDSLIVNDVRALLNKTELETIDILQLYYIHIFMGVEQLYRQSLIHETLDVHIRLSKLIFATDKHRLPWETFTNISSLTNAYRKSPNNMQIRPNVSMSLLKSLHHAYTAEQFDSKYSIGAADHIMTFTRLDLINGAGSAYVLGACLPSYKYSILQEDLNSFSVILTATHELGHNLGLDHDETENDCDDPRVRYIMSPKNMNTVDRRQLAEFSPCSIQQLNRFADNTTTTCWKNRIVSTRNDTALAGLREIISTRFGQIIDVHQQCQLQYGPRSIPFISVKYHQNQSLYEESICDQLRCFKEPEDEYMYWQDGAFDGTPCGEHHICQQKKCVSTNETVQQRDLTSCPYGDLFIPIPMLNIADRFTPGNMLCAEALNLLRSRGMNVTQLCYSSTLPFERLCCEECKKHRIPECGDQNPQCSRFTEYCEMSYMTVNGVPIVELCPYTCGKCADIPPPTTTTTTITTTVPTLTTTTKGPAKKTATKKTTAKKVKLTTPKPRKYVKPAEFNKYTCIDSADCSQLVKIYSKARKNVKDWCTEHSTLIQGQYFAERCPKYCSLCNITSECEEHKLCRNNGTCIKDEHGTYQCLCSSSKGYYGTLCEYRQTCLSRPCSSKTEYCIQTQGENHVCLSNTEKDRMRVILSQKKATG